jgi:hypothetical protein
VYWYTTAPQHAGVNIHTNHVVPYSIMTLGNTVQSFSLAFVSTVATKISKLVINFVFLKDNYNPPSGLPLASTFDFLLTAADPTTGQPTGTPLLVIKGLTFPYQTNPYANENSWPSYYLSGYAMSQLSSVTLTLNQHYALVFYNGISSDPTGLNQATFGFSHRFCASTDAACLSLKTQSLALQTYGNSFSNPLKSSSLCGYGRFSTLTTTIISASSNPSSWIAAGATWAAVSSAQNECLYFYIE